MGRRRSIYTAWTMFRYRNTRIESIPGARLARRPRGKYAAATRALLARFPDLDGARIYVDLGDMLQVEIEADMGDSTYRRYVVCCTAGAADAVFERSTSTHHRTVSYWATFDQDGITVIVWTNVHDDPYWSRPHERPTNTPYGDDPANADPFDYAQDGAMVAVRGTIATLDHRTTHQGRTWAGGVLDSAGRAVPFDVFPAPYDRHSDTLTHGAEVRLLGRVDRRADRPVLQVKEAS